VRHRDPPPQDSPAVLVLRQLLLSWVANAIVLAVVAWAFADIAFDGFGSLLVASALFGVLNTMLKPLLRLATVPLAAITLGLAWFAVSMLMLKLTDWLSSGFAIQGVETLFWATIVAWTVNIAVEAIGWRAARRSRRHAARGHLRQVSP
jgi:putative membrane protein